MKIKENYSVNSLYLKKTNPVFPWSQEDQEFKLALIMKLPYSSLLDCLYLFFPLGLITKSSANLKKKK